MGQSVKLARKFLLLLLVQLIVAGGVEAGCAKWLKPPIVLTAAEKTDFRSLVKVGYDRNVLERIFANDPKMIERILEEEIFQEPATFFRGFSGSLEKFRPSGKTHFGKNGEEVWGSADIIAPVFYSTEVSMDRFDRLHPNLDYPKELVPNGYIIEYQLPGHTMYTQRGQWGRPSKRPPEGAEWGWFSRDDIPDDRPYIKSVYQMTSAKVVRRKVTTRLSARITDAGYHDIVEVTYAKVDFDTAFKNGKPVKKLPKTAKSIRLQNDLNKIN